MLMAKDISVRLEKRITNFGKVQGTPAVHRSLSCPWYVSGRRGGSKISKPRFLNSVTLSQIDWNRPDPDGLRHGLRMIH